MHNILKSDTLTVRISPGMKTQLEDVARETGNTVSTIAKAAISKMLSSLYDADGRIVNTQILSNRAALNDKIAWGYFPLYEVSRAYGLSERTLQTLVTRGKIPHIVADRKRYVKLSNVEKLLKNGEKNQCVKGR